MKTKNRNFSELSIECEMYITLSTFYIELDHLPENLYSFLPIISIYLKFKKSSNTWYKLISPFKALNQMMNC